LADQIVFVVYPGITLLDLAGPLNVFSGLHQTASGEARYDIALVSAEGGTVPTDVMISVETDASADWTDVPIHTLITIGGTGVYAAAADSAFIAKIRKMAQNAARVGSVCNGAYLLAAAGCLDHRRAATHWDAVKRLQDDFPKVRVEVDPVYINDGGVWTSAGVTAGIDMALALLAEDLGRDVALRRAQYLVTYMVRPGGQSQFSAVLERQCADRSGTFDELHAWIAQNLADDLRVEQLAQYQNMSVRSFYRAYVSTVGLTPAKTVETIRVDTARELLETTKTGVKAIAVRCGFKNEERLRRAFTRHVGVTPTEYRDRFQSA